jgi:predicted secreted protein
MEEAALALILDKCLAAIDDGASPEAAADRYPSFKHEILPLLEICGMLSEGACLVQEELPPELRRLKMRLVQSPA